MSSEIFTLKDYHTDGEVCEYDFDNSTDALAQYDLGVDFVKTKIIKGVQLIGPLGSVVREYWSRG